MHIGKSMINDTFDVALKYPSTTHGYPSLLKTQFNPWKFIDNMKTLKTELSYDPHHIVLEKRNRMIQTPKDK